MGPPSSIISPNDIEMTQLDRILYPNRTLTGQESLHQSFRDIMILTTGESVLHDVDSLAGESGSSVKLWGQIVVEVSFFFYEFGNNIVKVCRAMANLHSNFGHGALNFVVPRRVVMFISALP
jgi:hypothetical protein